MYSNKLKIATLITFCLTLFSYGQIKIIDNDSKETLYDVTIINIKTNDSTTSNSYENVEITKTGTYILKKEGYKEKILELKNGQYYIIPLSIKPSELNEVVINANHIPKKLKKTTKSVSLISLKDIERSNNINFASVLNRTPGIFMQSGALNTNRITIRGIGSRNLYGTAKIRAYFKDIPLTNGSGETNIEDFELASISRIEITKGATSSEYGAGLGGTINITPKNAYLNASNINTNLLVGSFGLTKGVINLNHGTTKNSYSAIYSNTHSDGYRENNEYNRQTFTISSNHFLTKKDDISVLASYVDLKAFIPSSINESTYLNSPKSAAFTWKQSQGFEDSKRGIIGLSWKHKHNTNLKQITSIFSSFRNAYEPRPFNILKENSFGIGIRTRLLGQIKLFNKRLDYTFGGELFKDNYKYKTFENLYGDFPSGAGSVKGLELSNFKEKRNYHNAFIETNYEFSEKTTVSFGLNLNKTYYTLDDRFTISEANIDQSGSYKFKNILSPKLGVSHLISKNMSLYSNISHGFSPITLSETLLPDGQINTSLKPETGWNYEIGTRGSAINKKLQFNLAIYRLSIKNLLVARRTTEDEYVGINAGKTQHDGLEISLNYSWIQNQTLTISTFTNYTHNNFIFKEFIDDENDFSGNDLTGVPSKIFNAGIDTEYAFGLYGNINFQHVGQMPITDNNNLFSNSYNLTNLKFGFRKNIYKKLKIDQYIGINNIFNKNYASQVLINASGFGGRAPRYYYPGNPINYYIGININYIF